MTTPNGLQTNTRGACVTALELTIRSLRGQLLSTRERIRTLDRELRLCENALRELNVSPDAIEHDDTNEGVA